MRTMCDHTGVIASTAHVNTADLQIGPLEGQPRLHGVLLVVGYEGGVHDWGSISHPRYSGGGCGVAVGKTGQHCGLGFFQSAVVGDDHEIDRHVC